MFNYCLVESYQFLLCNLFIHLFIYLFIFVYIRCTYLLFIYLITFLFIYLLVYFLFIHPFVCVFRHSPMSLFFYSSICLSSCLLNSFFICSHLFLFIPLFTLFMNIPALMAFTSYQRTSWYMEIYTFFRRKFAQKFKLFCSLRVISADTLRSSWPHVTFPRPSPSVLGT